MVTANAPLLSSLRGRRAILVAMAASLLASACGEEAGGEQVTIQINPQQDADTSTAAQDTGGGSSSGPADVITPQDTGSTTEDVATDAGGGAEDVAADAGKDEDAAFPTSCINKCGKYFGSGAPCQCDNQCSSFGDCCPDYDVFCGGPSKDGGGTTDATDACGTSGGQDTTTAPDTGGGGGVDAGPTQFQDIGCQLVPPGLQPGALVINELMINPKKTIDEFGEWIEIYNPTDKPIPLGGLEVTDASGAKSFKIAGCTLFVNAGNVVVLGINGDQGKNGGYKPDYVYGAANFTMNNVGDSVVLKVGQTVIDQVTWTINTWPFQELDGKAANLTPSKAAADKNDKWEFTWCPSSAPMPLGDFGSPGKLNPVCPKPPDADNDEIPDAKDNCHNHPNPKQENSDADPLGDACDNCPKVPNKDQADSDNDNIGDACDKIECGDGDLDAGEECDDGNNQPNDG